MSTIQVATQIPERSSSKKFILLCLLVAGVVLSALQFVPEATFSDTTLAIMGVSAGFLLLLFAGLISLRSLRTLALGAEKTIFRLTALIWMFLLIAEALFDHTGDPVTTYQGSYASQAYGEVTVWVIGFLAVAIIALPRPQALRQLFTGSLKWATLFTAVCVVSTVYTPDKMYALAWCFKMGLVILLLAVCAQTASSLSDLVTFLRVTLWGYVLLTLLPVIRGFAYPATAFSGAGGRLEDA